MLTNVDSPPLLRLSDIIVMAKSALLDATSVLEDLGVHPFLEYIMPRYRRLIKLFEESTERYEEKVEWDHGNRKRTLLNLDHLALLMRPIFTGS